MKPDLTKYIINDVDRFFKKKNKRGFSEHKNMGRLWETL